MHKYFQPPFIKSQTINSAGLHEIEFKDDSRYVGDMAADTIQGNGTLMIQDIGRLEGVFFDNRLMEGKLALSEWLVFEGRFDEQERMAEGTLHFKCIHKKVKVKTTDGKVGQCTVLDKGGETPILKNINDRSYAYQDNYMLLISEDKETITLQKTYSVDYFNGTKIDFNIRTNVLEVANYEQGSLKGVQVKFSLEGIPYYQEYSTRFSDAVAPLYKVVAANGNLYTGYGGFDNGEVVLNGLPYVFLGGVDGPYKTGSGFLEFQDGYRKPVSYVKDKLTFDSLDSVFDFVANFRSTSVPGLSSTSNLDMIRLMDKIDVFEGKMERGTTEEPCTIIFKSQLKYVGRLLNFKMHGSGAVYTAKSKISGNFEFDELSYGIVEYDSGAKYEGQLQDLGRSGIGHMLYSNDYEYSGRFVNDVVARQGGRLIVPKKGEFTANYVHIEEFEIGIFVTEDKDLYVVDCTDESVHDARFIDELEKSGISIRESLKNISFKEERTEE